MTAGIIVCSRINILGLCILLCVGTGVDLSFPVFQCSCYFLLPFVLLVLGGIFHSGILVGYLSVPTLIGTPFVVELHLRLLADVVHFAVDAQSRQNSIAEKKCLTIVALFVAATSLDISHITPIIFFLQIHVHDVIRFVDFTTGIAAFLRQLVINLYILYGIVRQVVEHDFIVALEEVLAIKCQVVNFPSVDKYLAIAFQLRSWQLGN